MLKPIVTNESPILFDNDSYNFLCQYIKEQNSSKLFVIVDSHTKKECLPYFLDRIQKLENIIVIEIQPGETYKNITTCSYIWERLSLHGADRKSLIINLGGGVVTDLGGFVAATYMRGIRFINIPTSLLAMVDASVGGKTGVDLGILKNQVGVFAAPQFVIVDPQYLITLPKNHITNGIAEMLKHGLIHNKDHWDAVSLLQKGTIPSRRLVYDSVVIKSTIVNEDPKEQNRRKILNYGHTLGHAIESHYLKKGNKEGVLHGEAIAIGMLLESYISSVQEGLSKDTLKTIKETIFSFFEKKQISHTDIDEIIALLQYDKKNSEGVVNFVLLKTIAQPVIDKKVDRQLIKEAFYYYLN
ncbi:3-dehydroquinate synthase [Leptobacterium sp. I13]|uniref:3-dehydroquinate synthase n=1 Tax=Leptobacterium meishanense TaxID=3128904 RepID=UPI0030EE80D7